MEMSQIKVCNMSQCAYNMNALCHTLAITVGPHAECNTYNHGNSKGGFREIEGGIGACLASYCHSMSSSNVEPRASMWPVTISTPIVRRFSREDERVSHVSAGAGLLGWFCIFQPLYFHLVRAMLVPVNGSHWCCTCTYLAHYCSA